MLEIDFENIKVKDIVAIAKEAGEEIMKIYKRDFKVNYKDDKSPLTEADLKSNDVIIKALEKYKLPIMSEETKVMPYEERKNWEYYWCIDPIDGTKEFVKKNDEFTVNIALIYKDEPVLGVVYAPAIDEMYYAKKGSGAFKNGKKLPLVTNLNPQEKLCVVASKSHLSDETQVFIGKLDTKVVEQISKGSSLKLVMVAEGVADVYPRLAPTMEWDTAAADAIVRESGKMTYQYSQSKESNTEAMQYNKENLLNPWFIVR